MATKIEKTDGNFEIEMYRPDESATGHYEAHVQALIAADENRTQAEIDNGDHASIRVTFPKEQNGKPQIEKHKRWFRDSASAHGLSAKVVDETDQGDTIEFRYIVVPKITRPRKPKAVDAAGDSDVPQAA